MPQHTSADTPVTRALPLLLDELETTNRWMQELDSEFKIAGRKRERLIASIENAFKAGTEELKRRNAARFARLTAKPTKRVTTLRGLQRDMMAFLIESESEQVRGAELTWYARRMGHNVSFRYGSHALSRLNKTGHVTKIGHGIYRVNRHHPEMLAIQVELLDLKRKASVGD